MVAARPDVTAGHGVVNGDHAAVADPAAATAAAWVAAVTDCGSKESVGLGNVEVGWEWTKAASDS